MVAGITEFKRLLKIKLAEKRTLDSSDYVELYAQALKKDNRLFKQQKMLIDSQMQASREFFKNRFKGRDFKEAAREYLRAVGKI